ncbi:hypothetical protein [Nitrosarchaeum sp. AC2]|uniref:hypothetical protein n=1 Tax=Nitrosarchaeum sp. AC2 TaxID=2259673 RepID=UPI0015CC8AC3|nr:hypothetical protein [Nitrosarchaeum sp. AC2]
MKAFTPRKQTSDEVFKQFVEATRQIADDLNITQKNVNIERYETPTVGISYIAEGISKNYRFTFDLKTWAKGKDVLDGRMSPSLEISYSDSSAPFWVHEDDLKEFIHHPNFISRWAAWGVFNFNLKHNPANLESLFNDMSIRVYGIPQHTSPTIGEAYLLFGGINKYHSKRLLVYKFRHVEPGDKYRSFSYAFLCSHNNFHDFWVFFPNCGGLDSGGANGDLQTIEELISSVKVKVEKKNLDIKYEELESFLKINLVHLD